jgi:hypothetical protein
MTGVHWTFRAVGTPVALALLLACCATPSPVLAASPMGSGCVRADDALGCVHIAATGLSAGGSEAEEPGEELEEGSEEAGGEAEVEEEAVTEGGSASDRGRAGRGVLVSNLELTARATAALARHRPSASSIGFSFTLSAPCKVRVSLVEQVDTDGRELWATLPDSLTAAVAAGHVSRDLTGHNRLTPGRYRLTVKPLAGRSRSIYLSVRR